MAEHVAGDRIDNHQNDHKERDRKNPQNQRRERLSCGLPQRHSALRARVGFRADSLVASRASKEAVVIVIDQGLTSQ
jgi:hypothetical protein